MDYETGPLGMTEASGKETDWAGSCGKHWDHPDYWATEIR